MNNKILITVNVPMIDKEYDIYIPVSKNIKTTIDLLVKNINELSEGHFPLKESSTLMDYKGGVFAKNYTVKECGIKNGDKIILI